MARQLLKRSAMSAGESPKRIFLLSGGTGRTADQVLRAAIAQFPGREVEFVSKKNVRSKREAVAIVRQADADRGLVCHSLVDPKVREAVDTETQRLAIPCIDILGPALTLLGDYFDAQPRGRAGLFYELHHEQIDRMDAMDFTLAHDDGKRLHDMKNADVVLVGASRTTKSVTCCYLAFRGVRAANFPLIPGHAIPQELRRISRRRVVGLTMNAAHLRAIRQTRSQKIADREIPHYTNIQDIQDELREIRHLMVEHHWECIDVSYKATEEVASTIVKMLPKARRR